MTKNLNEISYKDISKASLDAIYWIDANKDVEPKLKDDAKNLHYDICSLITESKFAEDIASTDVQTVGVFGASQAGKSFLVSTLAADKNGDFKTTVNGVTFDFMKHLNPVGNDSEATGLATRFKHQNIEVPQNYSFLVNVFTEVDVAMLLLNSYFFDLDDLKLKTYDKNTLDELLQTCSKYIDENAENYIEPQHILEFAKYYNLLNKQENPYLDAKSEFFYKASLLIPKLNLEGRITFFSFFFGNLPVYSLMYKELASELLKLKGHSSIYVPKEAFLEKDSAGNYTQRTMSLNNIGSIKYMFSKRETMKVALDINANEEVDILFYHLVALTYELVFPVESESDFSDFDVIDFPGTRSRGGKSISTLTCYSGNLNVSLSDDEKENSGLEFIRRGKVGLIFDRYAQHKALDLLIVCLGVHQQAEVIGLGPILEPWVNMNIGKTPKDRERFGDSPPLIGVLTRANQMLEKVYFEPISRLDKIDGIEQASFDKFFDDCTRSITGTAWFKEFTPNKPFNNFFISRGTNFKTEWINIENGTEILKEEYKDKLDFCKERIINSSFFKNYVQESLREKTCDAFIAPNDGGLKPIIEKFKTAYKNDKRIDRVYTPLQDSLNKVLKLISEYADRSSTDANNKALEKAERICNSFLDISKIAPIFTKIKRSLEICEKDISDSYNFGSFDTANARAFAVAVLKKYNEKLDALKSDRSLKFMYKQVINGLNANMHKVEFEKEKYSFFYVDKELTTLKTEVEVQDSIRSLISDFIDEIKKSIEVLDLNKVLVDLLLPNEKDGATSDGRKFIQSRLAVDFISNFNHSLGQFLLQDNIDNKIFADNLHDINKEDIYDVKGTTLRPAFSLYEDLPKLNALTQSYSYYYLTGYLSTLKYLITEKNTSFKVKFNFSKEANYELIKILDLLEANKV